MLGSDPWTWDEMNAAIPAYLGYPKHDEPIVDWDAVVEAVGTVQANALEFHLLRVLDEVRLQKPDRRVFHVDRAAEWAVKQAAKSYPALDERARKALFWFFRHEHP